MNISELALKSIRTEDYLRLRFKAEHVTPSERTLIMRTAQKSEIDLQEKLDPQNPLINFLRARSAKVPLDKYIPDRKKFVGVEIEELADMFEDEGNLLRCERIMSEIKKYDAEMVILSAIAQALPKK